MTIDEIWSKLRDRNVVEVVIDFSGGGDEGGVDQILLNHSDGSQSTLVEDRGWFYCGQTGKWTMSQIKTEDGLLAAALVAPVHDAFGGFDGEAYLTGSVRYVVADQKIILSRTTDQEIVYRPGYR